MTESKQPLITMILFSIVRHSLAFLGVWALAHHWLTKDLIDRLIDDKSVAIVVAWIMTVVPVIWAILQKTQVWVWIQNSIHSSPGSTPKRTLETAPGPNVAI